MFQSRMARSSYRCMGYLAVVLLVCGFSACSAPQTPQDKEQSASPAAQAQSAVASPAAAVQPCGDTDVRVAEGYRLSEEPTSLVDIYLDTGKHIVIKLEPSVAPKTVENFQELVSQHFYDGLTFHRIIDGFMIQGGDPKGNGTGGSDKEIEGEFAENGHENPLSHVRGTVSMARAADPNSASSQFFICNGDAQFLDGQYAAFGSVVYGMDAVDFIAKMPKGANDAPLHPTTMRKVVFVKKA